MGQGVDRTGGGDAPVEVLRKPLEAYLLSSPLVPHAFAPPISQKPTDLSLPSLLLFFLPSLTLSLFIRSAFLRSSLFRGFFFLMFYLFFQTTLARAAVFFSSLIRKRCERGGIRRNMNGRRPVTRRFRSRISYRYLFWPPPLSRLCVQSFRFLFFIFYGVFIFLAA